ncbi:hypothetical protein ACFP1Z_13860 [Streptomyces gamaensis]|uniref:Secreted protein n=1 Tax=Streptomyces gamaensis TaxID=1763542 RepID=A0ABW0Z0F5_9ACTN
MRFEKPAPAVPASARPAAARFASGAITAVACGVLVLGAAGPAPAGDGLKSAPKPTPKAAAVERQLDTVSALGETLTLVSRIGKEAQRPAPNVRVLRDLQSRLRASGDALLAAVRLRGQAGRGTSAGHRAPAGPRASDGVEEVRNALTRLVASTGKAIADVESGNSAGLTGDIAKAVADAQSLTQKVSALDGTPTGQPPTAPGRPPTAPGVPGVPGVPGA